jgi:hypothetical protein
MTMGNDAKRMIKQKRGGDESEHIYIGDKSTSMKWKTKIEHAMYWCLGKN